MKISDSRQSRIESIIEQITNVGSGMIIAYCVMQFILIPAFDINLSATENIKVTVILTFVSVIRGYMWRRFFDVKLYKTCAEKIRGYLK